MGEFKERLKKALEHSGKRQIDVVNELHISKSNFSKYMRGELPMPKLKTINKIATYLRVRPEYLLGLDNFMVRANKSVEDLFNDLIHDYSIEEIDTLYMYLDVYLGRQGICNSGKD